MSTTSSYPRSGDLAEFLGDDIYRFVHDSTSRLIQQFFPAWKCAPFIAGHCRRASIEEAHLVHLLSLLNRCGCRNIDDTSMPEAICKIAEHIKSPTVRTFFSYFLAEAFLSFGSREANALMDGLSLNVRRNLLAAFDTTGIYDGESKTLKGYLPNYWAVLARAEFARKRLGVVVDENIFATCLEKMHGLPFQSGRGFLDDSSDRTGRYDIYSFDTHLFSEPLWQFLAGEQIGHTLRQLTTAAFTLAREDGALVGYGRSTSVLSLCMTMEWFSCALNEGLCDAPRRALFLIQNAFQRLTTLFDNGLISPTSLGAVENYRGPHLLLQFSLDVLSKMLYSTEKLRGYAKAGTRVPETSDFEKWPARDGWISFDGATSGVWVFRNSWWSFQLPCTWGGTSDYVPWFRTGSGPLDAPANSLMVCGMPVIAYGESKNITASLPPSSIRKQKNGPALQFASFKDLASQKRFEASRHVTYAVVDRRICIVERWHFNQIPDAITFRFTDNAGLQVDWTSNAQVGHHRISARDLSSWKSPWGGFDMIHEFDFTPQADIEFSVNLMI